MYLSHRKIFQIYFLIKWLSFRFEQFNELVTYKKKRSHIISIQKFIIEIVTQLYNCEIMLAADTFFPHRNENTCATNIFVFFFYLTLLGRGKMKKMMGMMMMGFAMKMAAMVPVAIAGLYMMAGKALIISKIALLLAGILGIKKLLASKQSSSSSSGGWQSSGSGGGGGSGWQSGGGGGSGGGWDRRSNDLATHSIVYKGYV